MFPGSVWSSPRAVGGSCGPGGAGSWLASGTELVLQAAFILSPFGPDRGVTSHHVPLVSEIPNELVAQLIHYFNRFSKVHLSVYKTPRVRGSQPLLKGTPVVSLLPECGPWISLSIGLPPTHLLGFS